MGIPKVSPRPEVTRPPLFEVDDPAAVPVFATEAQAADFWQTHGPTERYLLRSGEVLDDGLPPPRPRTTPVAIRFDSDTIARLKALGKRKNKGYQTLLKEFVCERLYEEEKREGVLPS